MSRSVSAPSSVTKTSPCWNGLIVPGSTLMYGSSLRLVTRMPREARIAARDAAAMPFPREETTPPVTKTNLVMDDKSRKFLFYRNTSFGTNLESDCGDASRRFTPSGLVVRAWRQSKAGLDARANGLATKQCQHRVD